MPTLDGGGWSRRSAWGSARRATPGLFGQAGQKVEDDVVRCGPRFVLEQAAKAPRSLDVQARNPANTVLSVRHGGHVLGAAHMLERLRTSLYRPLSDAVREEPAADVARRRSSELGD